jgi:hypothetical protein
MMIRSAKVTSRNGVLGDKRTAVCTGLLNTGHVLQATRW